METTPPTHGLQPVKTYGVAEEFRRASARRVKPHLGHASGQRLSAKEGRKHLPQRAIQTRPPLRLVPHQEASMAVAAGRDIDTNPGLQRGTGTVELELQGTVGVRPEAMRETAILDLQVFVDNQPEAIV